MSGPRRIRPITQGLIGVTGASWLGNVLSYLLVLLAARRLSSNDYASLVTLINLLLIGSVPSFALQAVAARRVAVGEERGLWQAGLLTGLGAGVVLAAISPLLATFLHLPSLFALLLVALALPATAVQGLCQGVVQGEQRFSWLAAITFVGIVGKSLGGLIGLVVFGTATATIAALVIGVVAAAAGSAIVLPELRRGWQAGRRLLPLIAEAAHASHAYGVFLLLSVSDVLLARHVLPSHAAAVYAAGSIVTKGTLWLPQSVANVLFASLVDAERHRRIYIRAVAGIAGVAGAIALCCWPLGWLAARVVAGDRYPELDSVIWQFAVLGGCLAIVQFSLVAGLALRKLAVIVLMWLTVLAETVGVFSLGGHPSVRAVISLMDVIILVSAAVAVGLRLRRDAGAAPAAAVSSNPAGIEPV